MRRDRRFDRVVTSDTGERVGLALDLVPPRILDRVGPVDFFEGDVVFAGVFQAETLSLKYSGDQIRDVRTEDCAHCCYRRDHSSFVTLPSRRLDGHGSWPGVSTILHELGHALYRRIVGPHLRTRVYWDRGEGKVDVNPGDSGLLPSMLGVSGYNPSSMVEQFAEAFSFWLTPTAWSHREDLCGDHPVQKLGARPAERLYYRTRRGLRDREGYLFDNRHLLAFLNELAGWPSDRLPPALH